jgi:hypothetical protein
VQTLPGHYRGINEQHLPAELFAGCNVVEHELPATSQPLKPLICLFVLDMCISEEDMTAMKVWRHSYSPEITQLHAIHACTAFNIMCVGNINVRDVITYATMAYNSSVFVDAVWSRVR